MMDGRIVRSGDKSLALELDEKGYDWLKPENSEAVRSAFCHRLIFYFSYGRTQS